MYTKCCILFLIILSLSKIDSSAITNRIVGGTFAAEGKYPFLMSLQILIEDKYKQLCGASLIAPNWALTAAHCVVGFDPQDIRVIAGITNLTETDGITASIVKVFLKNYSKATADNDISLLKLNRNIPENKKIKIIKLEEKDIFEVRKCWVAGWGRQNEGSSTSDRLKVISTQTVPQEHCTDNWHTFNLKYFHGNSQICTKSSDNSGTCKGDSGGPIFLDNNGIFTQIGLVSFGIGCARGINDIGTRLSYYYNWIKETMKNNN